MGLPFAESFFLEAWARSIDKPVKPKQTEEGAFLVKLFRQKGSVVLRPGFGPGSSARKAGILNRAILPER